MWLLLPVGLSALIFYPILRNYFFGDDLYFLFQIINAPFLTHLFTPYGGHLLIARNFVFFLCYQLFGAQAQVCFVLVLGTHLLNVGLLFRVLRILTDSPRLAAFGAALWGSALLQEGTLGWYSLYGNVMVGTATLWLLRDVAATHANQPITTSRLLLWPAVLFVVSTSYGVGLAITLVFPLVVLVMHARQPGYARAVACSALAAAALIPGYFLVHRLMLTAEAAAITTTTLTLETLTNVLALLPIIRDLAGYGLFSLTLREAVLRLPYSDAAGGAMLVASGALLVSAFVRGDQRTRGVILAGLAIPVAIFAAVAAGRGVLWGPKVYLATRYQYIPLIGVTIAICQALAALQSRYPVSATIKNAALLLWLIAAVTLHFTLSPGIDHHDHARRATDIEVGEMRRIIRATAAGQDVYITNQIFHGVGPLMIRNQKMFPGWAAAFTIFFPSNVVDGRRVFFVESDPEVLEATRNGKRTATLIVAKQDP